MSSDITRRQVLRAAGIGLGATAASGLFGIDKALGSTLFAGPHATDVLKLANVRLRSINDELALGAFDDTHAIPAPGHIEVLLWPGDQARMEELGLDYEITCEDVLARDMAIARATTDRRPPGLKALPGERTAYRRWPDYVADMNQLATDHPDLARVFALPEPTLEGRIVYGIEIAANVARQDGRPVMHMDGCHHSREWPAGEMPMMFAFDLIEGYGNDARTTELMEKVRFIIVPVMNVDGFMESREAPIDNSNTALAPFATMAYWRKNRRSFTGVTAPTIMKNPDAYGVDPNRNYSYQWGDSDGGSSSTQTDETHRGAAPFSEPESRNIRHLVMSRQTTGMLTHHTHGRLCMRPWGWTWDDAPDEQLQAELGEEMVSHNGYTNQKARGLYLTSGGSRCWTYGSTGCITYTFEHGTAFHPSYLSTIPAMYAQNREPFFLLTGAAADPGLHAILRGRVIDAAGQPVTATISITKSFSNPAWFGGDGTAPGGVSQTPESLATAMVAEPDGSFEYHVNPSRRLWLDGGENEAYEVTVSAGASEHQRLVVVSRGDVVDLGDVTLS